MRVKKSLRTGSAWAAAAALLVAPLVVAPLVSAAEPTTQDATESSAPGAQPAAAAGQAPADVAPSGEAASEESPAADAAPSVPASEEAPSAPSTEASEAPSGDAAPSAAASASTQAAAPAKAARGTQATEPAQQTAAAPQALSVEAAPQALAAAAPGTIVAKVVADRAASGSSRPTMGQASGIAGAKLKLEVKTRSRTSTSAQWGSESAWTFHSECVSDSSGACNLALEAISNSNLKQYRAARVVFVSAGTGGLALNAVGTGNYGSGTTAVDTLDLNSASLPASGQTAQASAIASNLTSRQAAFTVVRNNAALPLGKCGLKVGLLLDHSKSIEDANNGVDNLKAAANGFVDALTGTPSSILVRNFATSSPNHTASEIGLTSLATSGSAGQVKTAINTISGSSMGTYTNWDAGLWRMQGLGLDVVVVVTDGVPTAHMNGSANPTTGGYNSTANTVQHAVWSANVLKSAGTTVMAVGAGDSFNNVGAVANLKAISSSDQSYVATDLAALKAKLKELADQSCRGTVNVVKRVVNEGANDTSEATSTAGVGFNFKMGSGSYQSTNETGGTSFSIASNGTATFTEEQRTGYDIVAQSGKPAVCRNVDTGASVAVTRVSEYSFSLPASTASTITCTVYNKKKPAETSLVINHEWVDENGAAVPAADLDAIVLNDGRPGLSVNDVAQQQQNYGSSVSSWTNGGVSAKLTAGDSAGASEGSAPALRAGFDCRVSLVSITPATPKTLVADAASNVFTVKHRLTCTTELKLTKALATKAQDVSTVNQWTLTVDGKGSAKANYTTSVTPGQAYSISEDGPSVIAPNAKIEQKSLVCTAGYNESTKQVTVARGKSVTCTFTNQLVRLDVKKTAFKGEGLPLNPSQELASGSQIFGGTYTWLFTITNTGDAPVKVTSVKDSKLVGAQVTCSPYKDSLASAWIPFTPTHKLAAGEKYYCKATGTVAP